MNKKIKIFYISDLISVIISIIGMLILNSQKSYGLAALTSAGYFTICLLLFIVSVVLLISVSLIYLIITLFLKNK